MDTTHSNSQKPRTWLVTGASSGIGLALVQAAARRGDYVMAVARNVEPLTSLTESWAGQVLAHAVDVTDRAQVDTVVAGAVEAFGRIDVVANNAGYGLFGAVEEARVEQVRAIFETNVYGVLNVLWATLPVLRSQRSGHILQGSSYLGQTAAPGLGVLSATKYAVEGLSDALAAELAPLGIHVTMIEPSLTATPFLTQNLKVADTIDDYDQTVRALLKAVGELPPSAFNASDRVADTIIAAVDAENPPRRLATGSQAVKEIGDALQSRLTDLHEWESLSDQADTPLAATDA
jgi:NAD(P)-dependent dehydrogenase (short-subunit alcohol dehydrogenase family)